MKLSQATAFALFVGLVAPTVAQAQYGASSNRPVASEDFSLRATWRRWNASLASEFQRGSMDVAGTLIDPILDLGVEDKNTYELRGVLQFRPGHKLRVSYTKLDYRGDVTLDKDVLYGETTFHVGSQALTSLKGGMWSGGYEFDFSRGEWGFLGLLLGGKFLDVDSVLVAPAEGEREQDQVREPIPIAGLVGRFYLGRRLSVSGEFSGMSLGKRGWVYEAEALGRLHLSDRLAVEGGYRVLKLSGEDALVNLDARLDGITFGLELSL